MTSNEPGSSQAGRRLFERSDAANDGTFTPGDWGLFLAVAAIWGSSFLFIDIGLDAFPPGLITLLRVGSGALTLLLLPKPSVAIEASDRSRLVLLSVIWVAVPFTLFPIAEQYINSSVTGLLNGATPIFAATVAAVLLRQRAKGPLLLGIVVGFAGIVLISLPSIGDGASEARGVLLVLAATLSYGFAINLAAPLQHRYGSLPLMSRMLALATVWTLPYGLWEIDDATWEKGPARGRARPRRVRNRNRLRDHGQPRRQSWVDPRIVHHLSHPRRRASPRRHIPRRHGGTAGCYRDRLRDRGRGAR